MFTTRSFAIVVAIEILLASAPFEPGLAQGNGPSTAEINQWFDGLDSSSPWGQTPSSQSIPQAQSSMTSAPEMQPLSAQQNGFGNNLSEWQGAGRQPRIQGSPVSSARGMQTPFGRLTPKDVFRIMFEGGSGSGNDYARNQQAYGNASSYLQTALDQASQAEAAASRASYGSDKWARQSAASEAQNHANAARGAADSATSAAAGANNAAQDQAAKARDAAARAQYAADRAASNAAGGGW